MEITGLAAFFERGLPQTGSLKRWDGASRTCHEWDALRRDSELWFRGGNCLVYLYAKGHSRGGPSFNVSLLHLLRSKCYPLIQKFLHTDQPWPRTPKNIDRWCRMNRKGVVELYIPPISRTDQSQNLRYYVAIRNLFAWAFRRSLVGEQLGTSLIELAHSMREYRSENCTNLHDLIGYLDVKGYLNVANQPDYALAMLYMAEALRMRHLYIRAFVHCVRMNKQCDASSEYKNMSSQSKQLIRKVRDDMETRLNAATDMLSNFLDDELSESHIGIPSAARSHLERFRSFLLSFYASRMECYPPRAFDHQLLRTMRRDFGALYDLLVDDGYTTSEIMPTVAYGGMCIIQLIHTFDENQGYKALAHPLPLLPKYEPSDSTRFTPWRFRNKKLSPGERLLAHASLIEASNRKAAVWENELVQAFCKFEEETIVSMNKIDRKEKVPLVDGRKVCWILIYATYQVLRNITDVVPEVYDADVALYPIMASAQNLPPWNDAAPSHPLLLGGRGSLQPSPSLNRASLCSDAASVPKKVEIEPDIDYFALTHCEPRKLNRRSSCIVSSSTSSALPRFNSVSYSPSRRSSLRHSLRKLRASYSFSAPTSPSKMTHQETIIHGFGNDTSEIRADRSSEGFVAAVAWTGSILSTNSKTEDSTELSSQRSSDSDDTVDSFQVPDTRDTGYIGLSNLELNLVEDSSPGILKRRKMLSMLIAPARASSLRTRGSIRRPRGSIFAGGSVQSPKEYDEALAQHKKNFFPEPPSPTRYRYSIFGPDAKRNNYAFPSPPDPIMEDDWTTMQAFMDGNHRPNQGWEQYAELGGLTEIAR